VAAKNQNAGGGKKLDTREKRDPILDKKIANRYLVACTYWCIVYSIYLRRGRAAAGGGGGGWALDAGSRAAGVGHNGHGKRRSYRHSSSSFFTHAAVVNCEHTEAKAQIVGFRKRPKLPPTAPHPQKKKTLKKIKKGANDGAAVGQWHL
jgi:hypothetical protein